VLHAYAGKFDVTINLKNFLVFEVNINNSIVEENKKFITLNKYY